MENCGRFVFCNNIYLFYLATVFDLFIPLFLQGCAENY